jgi:hypothetical protein
MNKSIAAAGNTVVPAVLALEDHGFKVSRVLVGDHEVYRAARGDEAYTAEDPVTVLGLVRLVELRTWDWRASDSEIERVLRQFQGHVENTAD